MAEQKQQFNISPTLVLTIAAGVVLVMFGKGIMEKLGLSKSAEDKAKDKANATKAQKLADNDYWDYTGFMSRVPQGQSVRLLTNDSADKIAQKINDAYHYLWANNYPEIDNAFRSLNTQSQVVSVSYAFNRLYGKDLYEWLKSFMNDAQMAAIEDILDKKPLY